VFLVNSRLPLVTATPLGCYTYRGHTFFRSYGASLLSSLTTVLLSALVYSTRLPELVCGTVTEKARYEDFLGSLGLITSPTLTSGIVFTSRCDEGTDLPIPPTYRFKPGIATTRLTYPSSSPLRW
jgi:hypothetical protein